MSWNSRFVPDNPSPLSSSDSDAVRPSRDGRSSSYGKSRPTNGVIADLPSNNNEIISSDSEHKYQNSNDDNASLNKNKNDDDNVFSNNDGVTYDDDHREHDYDYDYDHDHDVEDDSELDINNSFIYNNIDIKNFPLFKKAPKSFYNKIISNLKLIQYHPQEFIIKKGDPSKSMYWILKGSVIITSTDGESVYSELCPGEFFGEIGILFNRPRTANVIAKSKVLLGVLTSKDFNTVLKSYPIMERRIRDEAQERLAMQDKKTKQYNINVLPPLIPAKLELGQDKVDATISIQEFLKNLPIFQILPQDIIHKLAVSVDPISISPFHYIIHENDIGANIYFIVTGQVEVLKFLPQIKQDKILARLNNGNYFGEMSFLNSLNDNPDFKRSASIRSITNVELIVVKSEVLKDLCNRYPFLVDHMKSTSEQRNFINQLIDKSIDYEQNEFTNFEFKFDFKPLASRSVSPSSDVTDDDLDSKTHDKTDKTHNQPGINTPQPQSLLPLLNNRARPVPKKSFSFNLTCLQPSSQFQISEPDIDYIPHNKRIKLQSLGRRKSSVLSHTGPLTEKLLMMVFQYLNLPTLMKLRCINRRWRQLLYLCPDLCKTLDLTPWNTTIDDKALIEITKFVGSRPTVIDISNCFHITDESFSYMVNEIGISGKLKVLKMRSNWELSGMAIMDLAVPSVGKYLQEIDLSNCRKLRDNVMERLIGWNNSLYEYQESEDIGCKQLSKINISYCKHLTDNIMCHIANNCNERLTELNMTRCTTITDKGFEFWTYNFFPNLTKLSLKDCTFLTDKSIISIANSVPNLQWLDLSFCCSLSDIAIEVLCIGCQNLTYLDLSFCGSAVSDSSLLAVSLNLSFLQSLVLRGCIRVTRAGIDSLLSGNSPLNYLNVSQCKNSDIYPGSIPAQKLNINPKTKSAFVTAGGSQKVIEIVI